MNPPCARCDKIVYPTEKVSCLDKVWHKACFHCEVCKMTLQMKNYKGYDKKPYCSAHYPKQTFTTVADTPENLRLKQQSELQSQVKYKEDFEKSRGKAFSLVPDTPELRRMKKAQEQISNVGYPQLGKAAVGGGQARQTSAAPQQGTLPPMTAPHPLHHRPSMSSLTRQEPLLNNLVTPPHRAPHRAPHCVPPPPHRAPPPQQGTFRALYDYVAADEDELSFAEGELFCNVQRIDDGWLYGTVARTGATGMLPANYVERT
ncbi:unnamed protein product [Lampetra planeri]